MTLIRNMYTVIIIDQKDEFFFLFNSNLLVAGENSYHAVKRSRSFPLKNLEKGITNCVLPETCWVRND